MLPVNAGEKTARSTGLHSRSCFFISAHRHWEVQILKRLFLVLVRGQSFKCCWRSPIFTVAFLDFHTTQFPALYRHWKPLSRSLKIGLPRARVPSQRPAPADGRRLLLRDGLRLQLRT